MSQLNPAEQLDPLLFGDWHIRSESCSGEESWYRYAIVNGSGELLATPQRSTDDSRRPEDQRRIDFVRTTPDLYRCLLAASHALRSYQHGNASPDLAESIADEADAALNRANRGGRF